MTESPLKASEKMGETVITASVDLLKDSLLHSRPLSVSCRNGQFCNLLVRLDGFCAT